MSDDPYERLRARETEIRRSQIRQQLVEYLKKLPNEERLMIFEQFCPRCGGDNDPKCACRIP